jgi:hypothetical protein
MNQIAAKASGLKLAPAFTMKTGFVGTWGASPGDLPPGCSVFGAAVVAVGSDWDDPPPAAGPTIIPNCSIQTPTGIVYNSILGQIPVGTPVMSQGNVFLGILGFEPGQVNPNQWQSADAPAWQQLGISPVIPCEIPSAPTTTNAALKAQIVALVEQISD